jgi:hypothetical protein
MFYLLGLQLLVAISLFAAESSVRCPPGSLRSSGIPSEASLNASDQFPTIPFCELVTASESYKDKVVKTKASYIITFESSILYSLNCNDEENYVRPILDCGSDEACAEMQAKISKELKGDPFSGRRAELTIIGKLRLLPEPGHQYSQQGKPRLGFAISQIEEVVAIPATAPMPWGKKKRG